MAFKPTESLYKCEMFLNHISPLGTLNYIERYQ